MQGETGNHPGQTIPESLCDTVILYKRKNSAWFWSDETSAWWSKTGIWLYISWQSRRYRSGIFTCHYGSRPHCSGHNTSDCSHSWCWLCTSDIKNTLYGKNRTSDQWFSQAHGKRRRYAKYRWYLWTFRCAITWCRAGRWTDHHCPEPWRTVAASGWK